MSHLGLSCFTLAVCLLQIINFNPAFGIVCEDKEMCHAKADDMKTFMFGLLQIPDSQWIKSRIIRSVIHQFHTGPFIDTLENFKKTIEPEQKHALIMVAKQHEQIFFSEYKLYDAFQNRTNLINHLDNRLYDGCIRLCRDILRDTRTMVEPDNADNNSDDDNCIELKDSVVIIEDSDSTDTAESDDTSTDSNISSDSESTSTTDSSSDSSNEETRDSDNGSSSDSNSDKDDDSDSQNTPSAPTNATVIVGPSLFGNNSTVGSGFAAYDNGLTPSKTVHLNASSTDGKPDTGPRASETQGKVEKNVQYNQYSQSSKTAPSSEVKLTSPSLPKILPLPYPTAPLPSPHPTDPLPSPHLTAPLPSPHPTAPLPLLSVATAANETNSREHKRTAR